MVLPNRIHLACQLTYRLDFIHSVAFSSIQIVFLSNKIVSSHDRHLDSFLGNYVY